MMTVSHTGYTLKFETSLDGKDWTTFMDGNAAKQ